MSVIGKSFAQYVINNQILVEEYNCIICSCSHNNKVYLTLLVRNDNKKHIFILVTESPNYFERESFDEIAYYDCVDNEDKYCANPITYQIIDGVLYIIYIIANDIYFVNMTNKTNTSYSISPITQIKIIKINNKLINIYTEDKKYIIDLNGKIEEVEFDNNYNRVGDKLWLSDIDYIFKEKFLEFQHLFKEFLGLRKYLEEMKCVDDSK